MIALLVNPNYSGTERIIRDGQEAARVKGVQLSVLKASTEREIDTAFASLVQLHGDALVVGADPFFAAEREQLVAARRSGCEGSVNLDEKVSPDA